MVAASRIQVKLHVGVAGRNGIGAVRGTPQIGVQQHSGSVDHPPKSRVGDVRGTAFGIFDRVCCGSRFDSGTRILEHVASDRDGQRVVDLILFGKLVGEGVHRR